MAFIGMGLGEVTSAPYLTRATDPQGPMIVAVLPCSGEEHAPGAAHRASHDSHDPALRCRFIERTEELVVQDVMVGAVPLDVNGHHMLGQGRGNLTDSRLQGVWSCRSRIEEQDDECREEDLPDEASASLRP